MKISTLPSFTLSDHEKICQHVLTGKQFLNITINKSMKFTLNLQCVANKNGMPKKEQNYLNKPNIVPATRFSNKPKYRLGNKV